MPPPASKGVKLRLTTEWAAPGDVPAFALPEWDDASVARPRGFDRQRAATMGQIRSRYLTHPNIENGSGLGVALRAGLFGSARTGFAVSSLTGSIPDARKHERTPAPGGAGCGRTSVSSAAGQNGGADARTNDEAGFEADGSGCASSSVVQPRSGGSLPGRPDGQRRDGRR